MTGIPDIGAAYAERSGGDVKKKQNPFANLSGVSSASTQNPNPFPAVLPGSSPDSGQSLNLLDSLKLWAPGAIANSVAQQAGLGKTDQQQQVEAAQKQRDQMRIQAAQQDLQASQQRKQMEKQSVLQQLLSLQQSAQAAGAKADSVAWQQVSDADLSALTLLEKAAKDAQKAKMQKRKKVMMPTSTKKGPVDPFGAMKDKKTDAMQLLQEHPGGE